MTDLSNLTDEELEAMLAETEPQDLSGFSDEELEIMLGEQSLPKRDVRFKGGVPSGAGMAALEVAPEGAFMGWYDELVDPLAALGVTAMQDPRALLTGEVTDPTLIEELPQMRERSLARREAAREIYPKSSIAGEVGGAIAGAIPTTMLGMGAARAMPALQKGGEAIARTFPTLSKYAAASGVGAGGAGIYGAGVGNGDAKERLASGLEAAPYGAGFGIAGAAVGQYAPRVVKSLSDRAKRLFGRRQAKLAAPIEDVAKELPISGEAVARDISDIVDEGDVTTMLKGARAQDVDLMRKEALARGGILGEELERRVRAADDAFMQSVKNTTQALAGEGTEETAQDTLVKSVNLVKRRYDAEKRLQGALMDKRNQAIAKAKVYSDFTKETLGDSLEQLKNSPDFVVNLQREGNKPVKESFEIIENLMKTGDDKTISMPFLASWRSSLNDAPAGSQQGALNSKMAAVYDDWLEGLTKRAMKEGDEDTVSKIFEANKSYRQFKEKFGTDKFKGQKAVIEKMLREDDMTPRAMVNSVFGKSLDGKDYTEQYVKRMVEAMPEGAKRDEVIQGFRAGLYQKAFEDSIEGETVKLGKLKNNLIKLGKNDAYKKYIATGDAETVRKQLIDDLGKYQRATTDKDIVNLSGTTPMAARLMQSIGALPVVRNISLSRGAAEGLADIAKSGANAKSKRQVEKSLADFYKVVSPEIEENIKFRFGGAQAGGVAGAGIME